MNDRVRIDIDALGVAEVRLVRGDKMNALDAAMFSALTEALAELRGVQRLRAVVLHGEGKAFCAGLDMGRFQAMADTGGAGLPGSRDLRPRTHGLANAPQHIAFGWRELPVPVIAAVHGVAFGGGLQLALGADIRLLAPDTKLSVMEIKWGLVPDMAGMALVRGLLRDDVLRELTYTNREFTGAQAGEYGFATIVDANPVARATAIAAEIANRNPHAQRAAKRLFNRYLESSTDEILMAESVEQTALIGSRNQIEAVRSQMEKRKGEFVDP